MLLKFMKNYEDLGSVFFFIQVEKSLTCTLPNKLKLVSLQNIKCKVSRLFSIQTDNEVKKMCSSQSEATVCHNKKSLYLVSMETVTY